MAWMLLRISRSQELLWFQNLFQPSTKLKTKVHVSSKIRRAYERPKTPFARLITSRAFNRTKMAVMRIQHASLDPFELSDTMDQKLSQLRTLALPICHRQASCGVPPLTAFAISKNDVCNA